ncbi:hypothetical protein I3J09_29430 (plasmid) [Streptomyces clavuligerus]|nr:hypothetical protein BB341_27815 [Streptomyces clavuligerus]AXU17040.1 hypothetical protein D1794_30870 [Streptomyces clavuligerus]MBY6307319.1 hypothetical protein [Streptomyces clavuligerus]QCS10111.1 hypothetical protein CRV15_31565 [Streptomyces clavuligerus]QPJ97842.1 hypothetical protein GE265_32890 [Streptomyces clavuligerus]
MAKAPEGFVHVRAHLRRKPGPRKAKRMSGWTIAGLLAGVWLWGQTVGFGESATGTPPAAEPRPSASSTPTGQR